MTKPLLFLTAAIIGVFILSFNAHRIQKFGGTLDCGDGAYTKITYDNPNLTIPSEGFYSTNRNGDFFVGITSATGTPEELFVWAKDIQPWIDQGYKYVEPVLTEMARCTNGSTKVDVPITKQESDAYRLEGTKPQK